VRPHGARPQPTAFLPVPPCSRVRAMMLPTRAPAARPWRRSGRRGAPFAGTPRSRRCPHDHARTRRAALPVLVRPVWMVRQAFERLSSSSSRPLIASPSSRVIRPWRTAYNLYKRNERRPVQRRRVPEDCDSLFWCQHPRLATLNARKTTTASNSAWRPCRPPRGQLNFRELEAVIRRPQCGP